MFVFQITDIRDFTHKLFVGDTFDWFEMALAEFQTACRIRLDGRLVTDYFDNDLRQELLSAGRKFVLWKEMKPLCYQIVKGRRTPLSFRIVLNVSGATPVLDKVLDQAAASGCLSGLSIRFEFSSGKIVGATGVSLSSFSTDRNPEFLWDEAARNFLRSHEIVTEKL